MSKIRVYLHDDHRVDIVKYDGLRAMAPEGELPPDLGDMRELLASETIDVHAVADA